MGNRRGRQGAEPGKFKSRLIVFFGSLALVAVFGVVGAVGLCAAWLQDLPDYDSAESYNIAQPTKVYASDGATLLAEFAFEIRDPVAFSQISDYVVEGTVATEDQRFYEHGGVDVVGIARALVNNVTGGDLEGGSTITQQFVRNTILIDEMDDISLRRKVREAYIALRLEERYSKDEILLMYLNAINYGCGAYGIEAASERYYSKSASELTLGEAAVLVGIPQSPTYNNPIDNPENSLARRNVVLRRMLQAGVIAQDEYDAAVAEPIELNPRPLSETGVIAYPYFVSYVRNQLAGLAGEHGFAAEEISKGGMTVVTTLDVGVQQAAERAASEKRRGSDALECSIVAIDPGTGHIKAMVGGTDYSKDQVNMATGEGGTGRQAGSVFKTFALAAAVEQGISPDTLVDAGATAKLPGWDGTTVANINHYDYGVRSVESAFWASSNTAFARLCGSIGADSVVEMAHRLGVKSSLPEVPSITLGTGSVTPLEMANAFATLAAGGVYREAECIAQVYDSTGELIVDNASPAGERVLSEGVSGVVVDALVGVVEHGTGADARLANGQVAGGKTGTTDDYLDSWFCGITPQYAVAIWYGDRSDYAEAQPVEGSCAGVFASFLDRVLVDCVPEEFFAYDEPDYIEGFADATYHIGSW